LWKYAPGPEFESNWTVDELEEWEPIVFLLCRNNYQNGVDVDQHDDEQNTPLVLSILFEHIPFTKLFLDYGARLCEVYDSFAYADRKIPIWALDLATGRENCFSAVVVFVGIRKFGRSRVMQNNVRDMTKMIGKFLWETRFLGEWAHIPIVTKPKRHHLSKSV